MGRCKALRLVTSKNGESGTQLVEFALVLLPLLLLLFGIIQYGLIFASYMTVRNATVRTARWATLGPTNFAYTATQFRTKAKQEVLPLLNPNNVTVVNVITNNVTAGVTNTSVQIQYKLPLIIPFVVPGKTAGGSLTLTSTSIMER